MRTPRRKEITMELKKKLEKISATTEALQEVNAELKTMTDKKAYLERRRKATFKTDEEAYWKVCSDLTLVNASIDRLQTEKQQLLADAMTETEYKEFVKEACESWRKEQAARLEAMAEAAEKIVDLIAEAKASRDKRSREFTELVYNYDEIGGADFANEMLKKYAFLDCSILTSDHIGLRYDMYFGGNPEYRLMDFAKNVRRTSEKYK